MFCMYNCKTIYIYSGPGPRTRKQTPTDINIISKDIKIINLSNRKLTDAEILLLNKGLKFTPTPKLGSTQELTEDVNEFNSKLRLAEYFDGTEDHDISLVKNKSKFIPPNKRNDALDEFINAVEKFPKTPIQSNVKK